MVVLHNAVEVHLVEASSKAPFKEHTRKEDGAVYAEVEPDVEYFISLKPLAPPTNLLVRFSVDDKPLEYSVTVYQSNVPSHDPTFHGLLQTENNSYSNRSLKFSKPTFASEEERKKRPNGGNFLMGKIKIDVYEAKTSAAYPTNNHYYGTSAESMTADPVDVADTKQLHEKKVLRSTNGDTYTEKRSFGNSNVTAGGLLDTMTLNYCAAVGLIEVGILPKPDYWTHARMLHPEKKKPRKALPPKEDSPTGVETFDLLGNVSENDGE